MNWRWLLIPMAVPALWVSSAFASAVYLLGMGYSKYLMFPWLQFWIAMPYVITDVFHGIHPRSTLMWSLIGFCFAVMPLCMAYALLRRKSAASAQTLYGTTGLADHAEMQRGGLSIKDNPLQ